MDKEKLFQHVQAMNMSSTKNPKYMAISSLKTADILDVSFTEIERGLEELVNEGKLVKSTLNEPPHCDIQAEIHAILTSFCGACIWFNLTSPTYITLIVLVVIVIRMLAIRYDWQFPLPIHRIH